MRDPAACHSPAAEDDQPVRRLVRPGGDRDALAGDDADGGTAHAPGDLADERRPGGAPHAGVPARERPGEPPLDLHDTSARGSASIAANANEPSRSSRTERRTSKSSHPLRSNP